jgi:thiosulfate dehydrogenase [quinone] large subunit
MSKSRQSSARTAAAGSSGRVRDASSTGWALLALRGYLAVVFVDGGLSKIADRRFLDGASPLSMHASVQAVRSSSPIGGLLGPVAAHSFAFGVMMAVAELAVGLGIAFGLFTRGAAAGGMLLALSLWLTVSWGATPWFTSADLVYLFAFTPLLIAGAGGVLSADAWLAGVRVVHPGAAEDRLRRSMLAGALAVAGAAMLGAAAAFRRSGASPAPQPAGTALAGGAPLTSVAAVSVGGGRQVTDPVTQTPAWVLQLQPGQITAYDATCPHQGCTVNFVSAGVGFACPCHGSRFDAQGKLLAGPASRNLTPIPVTVGNGMVTTR